MDKNHLIAAIVALAIVGGALFFLKGGGHPSPPSGRLWTQTEVDMATDMARIEERNKILLGK